MANYAAELSIVLTKNGNKEIHETLVKYYKDGQAVSGVGDMATWSEKKTQITFL